MKSFKKVVRICSYIEHFRVFLIIRKRKLQLRESKCEKSLMVVGWQF